MPLDNDKTITESADMLRTNAEKFLKQGADFADVNNYLEAIARFQDALNLYRCIAVPTQEDIQQIFNCCSYIEDIYAANEYAEEAIALLIDIIGYLKNDKLDELRKSLSLETYIAAIYEKLCYHYNQIDYLYESLACALEAATIYEKMIDVSPSRLLNLYINIIDSYISSEEFEYALEYCKKALRIYYGLKHHSDEIKEIAGLLLSLIDDAISSDSINHTSKCSFYRLYMSFPKLLTDLYNQEKYDTVIQFCRYINGSFHLSPPIANTILLTTKSHLILGMIFAKSNKQLEAISEFYRAIDIIGTLIHSSPTNHQHAKNLIHEIKNQILSLYNALASQCSLTNNWPLYRTYHFCRYFFTSYADSSISSNLNNDFINYLQEFIDMCSELINTHNKNFSDIACALTPLLPFILDRNINKLFCDTLVQELLSLPSNIDKIKLLYSELNRYYLDLSRRDCHNLAHLANKYSIFSPISASNTTISEDNASPLVPPTRTPSP